MVLHAVYFHVYILVIRNDCWFDTSVWSSGALNKSDNSHLIKCKIVAALFGLTNLGSSFASYRYIHVSVSAVSYIIDFECHKCVLGHQTSCLAIWQNFSYVPFCVGIFQRIAQIPQSNIFGKVRFISFLLFQSISSLSVIVLDCDVFHDVCQWSFLPTNWFLEMSLYVIVIFTL